MNINTYHYRSWIGVVQKQRNQGVFSDKNIPYMNSDLIHDITQKLNQVDKCGRIAVLYTIGWAIYLLHQGFTNVCMMTDKYDKSIDVWCKMLGIDYILVDDAVKKIKENKMKKFNKVVGNPPYLSGVWIDFMKKSMLLTDEYLAMVSPSANSDVSSKYKDFREELVTSGLQSMTECHDPHFKDVTTSTPISYYIIDRRRPGDATIFAKENSIINDICDKVLAFTSVNGGLEQVSGQHGYKNKNATGTVETIMSIGQGGATLQNQPRSEVRLMDNATNYFFVNQIIGRDANSFIYETSLSSVGLNNTVFTIVKPPGYNASKFKEVYLSKLMRGVLATFRGTRITQGWQLAKMPIVPSSITDLYTYFGLTQEEKDYIEENIK